MCVSGCMCESVCVCECVWLRGEKGVGEGSRSGKSMKVYCVLDQV